MLQTLTIFVLILLQPFKLSSNYNTLYPLSIGRVERLLVDDGFYFLNMPKKGVIKYTIEQIKEKLNKFEHFKSGEYKVKKYYYKGKHTKILVENKFGEMTPYLSHLLNGRKPDIRSAVDKTAYFKAMLFEKNNTYKSGKFWVIGEYIKSNIPILIENKFGKLEIIAANLLKFNKNPDIEAAINKTSYLINQFREIWKDRYIYKLVDYKDHKTNINIICSVKGHGVFPRTPDHHLRGVGCPKCGRIRIAEYNQENSSGWTCTNWKKAAKKSKYFDSFKVYIIRCYNENEEFYKIGRTFLTIKDRFQFNKLPYKYEIIKVIEYKTNPRKIYNLERDLKRQHKPYKYLPKIQFRGMHECFTEINFE